MKELIPWVLFILFVVFAFFCIVRVFEKVDAAQAKDDARVFLIERTDEKEVVIKKWNANKLKFIGLGDTDIEFNDIDTNQTVRMKNSDHVILTEIKK